MKIEVRNLKHSASLSEETYAYTATIYVDGKKAFNASNHGTGGPDMYHPIAPFTYADLDRVNAYLKENNAPDTTYGVSVEHDLEVEVGNQISNLLARKQLDRILRTKLVVIADNAVQSYSAKFKPTEANIAKLKQRGEAVVNGNPELYEKALALL